MEEFLLSLGIAAIIAVIAYVIGVAVPLEWMHWWIAALVGLVLSFGGWLGWMIIVDGDGL